jgi:hypothetical protein
MLDSIPTLALILKGIIMVENTPALFLLPHTHKAAN